MYHLPDRLFELIRLCGDDQFHRKKGTCHQIRYLLHHVGSLSGRCEERVTDEGIWSLDKNRNRRNNYRTFVLNFQILVQVGYLTANNDNVATIILSIHICLLVPQAREAHWERGKKGRAGLFFLPIVARALPLFINFHCRNPRGNLRGGESHHITIALHLTVLRHNLHSHFVSCPVQ